MAFLQEDEAALEAALAFVDEFAGVDAVLLPPSSSAPSLEEQVAGRNDTRSKSSTRPRRRAAATKPESEEEKNLQLLQNRQSGGKKAKRAATLAKNSLNSQLVSLWEGLAEQQRRRREEAERDNVLLKLAVERQRKVANELARMMKKRSTQLVRSMDGRSAWSPALT
jgi:predicted transcriptional regulator